MFLTLCITIGQDYGYGYGNTEYLIQIVIFIEIE